MLKKLLLISLTFLLLAKQAYAYSPLPPMTWIEELFYFSQLSVFFVTLFIPIPLLIIIIFIILKIFRFNINPDPQRVKYLFVSQITLLGITIPYTLITLYRLYGGDKTYYDSFGPFILYLLTSIVTWFLWHRSARK